MIATMDNQLNDPHQIVGISRQLHRVLEMTDKVAASDCSVLIEGESGTGKELIARRLHSGSARRAGPFIPVNCAGISASLFESQFFGHVRGAFTGAVQDMHGLIRTANGGTLLLDEVGDIPLELQPKLLRTLQEQEVMPVGKAQPIKVDTRFIAATCRSLKERITQGTFREDLYFRLNVVRLFIPPLRERTEDIPVLLEHYSQRAARRHGVEQIKIPTAAVERLIHYPWPGNVRELASLAERLYATGLDAHTLVDLLFEESTVEVGGEPQTESFDLQTIEKRAILRAMEQTERNQRQAAALLNIHPSTLHRKLVEYRLA